MTTEDPFATPAKIASEFASADSFRGRIVMIVPTRLELDVPNMTDPSKLSDRLTADVTTLDGKGQVQIFSYKAPTGKFLAGPAHKGVWFSQERIVKAVCPDRMVAPGAKPVLGILETYKPGVPAGPGNPWGLVEVTPEQKAAAIQELARIMGGGAAAPAPAPQPAPAAETNPFDATKEPPF